MTARVAELIAAGGAPMPGALAAVPLRGACRSRWRCARAPTPWSSRPPSAGWASSRRSTVWHSAEWEPLGKPHPGAYLSTAAKLGVDPTGCLAVEDSFNGAISAKAARMRVVVVPEPAALGSPRWGFCDARPALARRSSTRRLLRSLEELGAAWPSLTSAFRNRPARCRWPVVHLSVGIPGHGNSELRRMPPVPIAGEGHSLGRGDRATRARTGGRPGGPRRTVSRSGAAPGTPGPAARLAARGRSRQPPPAGRW